MIYILNTKILQLALLLTLIKGLLEFVYYDSVYKTIYCNIQTSLLTEIGV